MTNRSFADDPMEIKRLIEYHGCTPICNAQGELGISIPISCIHLEMVDGKSSCKIHDTKPVVCQNYFCGKVMKTALEKSISNGVHV
jgi:Fe-S-cluster containining protein